jgi:competence protein ComEC
MKHFKKYLPYILIFSIFAIGFFVLYLVYKPHGGNLLKVVFLDVGQGDAIYVEAPNGKQVLIDGGPDAKLLSSLAEVMPFADRSIDMLIATHPDMDHIGGFPLILDNYKVKMIIDNGTTSTSDVSESLGKKIEKKKINKIIAHRGMHIILDDKKNIYLDILFPDRDVSDFESNEASIVAKLVYGENSFLFTGDANLYTENLIEWNEKESTLDSDVLKLGHHGSKTSSSILWLEKVSPKVAIISVDKNNKYGHPHPETLDRLEKLRIPFLSTADKGNIIFKSDGIRLSY